jgi:Tetracyclin repressor-like, C-terminal domain
MKTGASRRDRLGGVGLAYFDFALQKRGLFRLMFGPILVERAKYRELNEATSAVFGLLRRVAVSADEWPCEDDVAGMAAWGLVMACSTPSSPRLAQEVAVCRSLVTH